MLAALPAATSLGSIGSLLTRVSFGAIRAQGRGGDSPRSGIGHGCPRFLFGQSRALLQQLDRDVVRRADEGHAAVARRPIDGHAGLLQLRADRVNVVNLECEVSEVAR